MGTAASIAASLLPVLAFLLLLQFLDSFKLLAAGRTLISILAGGVVAGVCYVVNSAAFLVPGPHIGPYVRFGAPTVEEVLKAVYLFWLIRESRVGFMVDAAISGFAIGAGFALVENAVYLHHFSGGGHGLWIVRGFGTAMMHGGTTAIVGVVGSALAERWGARSARIYAPGLLPAIVIHSLYNQRLLSPVASAAVMLGALPIALTLVFMRSEQGLRKWLGSRLDQDIDLMHMISSGQFGETHAGKYLRTLKGSFAPAVVGDMLCLLQLSLELGARAKGELLMREAGFPPPPDPTLPAQFAELRYLEKSIGAAGRLAMAPLISQSPRDLWQMQLLHGGQERSAGTLRRLVDRWWIRSESK